MSFLENNFFLLAITFGIFFFAKLLQKKTGLVLLNPILLTIALLIIFLKMTNISYETYNKGGHLIEFWLRPAVVALGVPLYLQLEMIKKQLLPILLSQLAGCIVGVISVVLIAKFMGASQEVILSLAPKSVTTPIAMEVTKAIGGIPSLTAAVVVAVGLLGAICGFKTMKIMRVGSPIAQGLMGGGANITPGEVSLAHNGVLFLDELPEFRRAALETLRQPLETGQVVISRASGTMTFPCRFMLAAAMNPCPCGYLGDRRRACTCPPAQIARYRRKISGPLLDRFDLLMEVPAVDPSILASSPAGECSASIRERVAAARRLQSSRYAGTPFRNNAALSGKALQKYCRLLPEGRAILLRAVEELALSARAYDRILKVARTIADLEGTSDIQDVHLYEAVQYRAFEQSLRD